LSFLEELRRRNVLRVGLAYLAGAWLLIQIVETLFPVFGLGDAAVRVVVIVLAIGFVPVLVFSWVFELTPQGLMRESEVDRSDSVTRETGKKLDRAIMLVLALALGYFAFDKFVLSPQREAELVESATRAGIEQAREEERAKDAEIPHESIAVLPFVNLSGDGQNEYFSDGLTETLLHMLAQLPDLRVSARTSSFAFKGRNVDVREIALALGVAHVLEGSVQKAGDRVRITAQLIRADDGFHVWSNNYDRTLDDIFAIQDEIAADVAASMGSALLSAGTGGMRGVGTSDISAFDIYLKALEQQAINTNDALVAADKLFRAALATDAEFHDARTGLARNILLQRWKDLFDDEGSLSEALELLTDVLDQQPDDLSARGLKLMAQLNDSVRRMDFAESDNVLEQLLPLMDEGYGDSYVRRFMVENLNARERYDEALAVLRAGLVVDPLNFDLLWAQAEVFSATGRFGDAVQPLMAALKLSPDNPLIYWRLSLSAHELRDIVGELDWLRKGTEADPDDAVLTRILSRRFYWLGLLEEADYWRERTRQIDPGWTQARDLDIWSAAVREHSDELLALTRDTIDRAIDGDGRPGLLDLAVSFYTYVMHKRGQSQLALEYVTKRLPEIDDVTTIPDDWLGLMLQANLFPLRSDIMDTEAFRELATDYVAAMDAAGIPYQSNKSAAIAVAMWLGDLDYAKEIFAEHFANISPLRDWWQTIFRSPWLAEFRADPDVAARLEEVLREKDEFREQVRQMLDEPAWSHQQTE
jgi:TolB-like protein/tetratricopeptide (TPR) repeat protein